MQQTEPLAPPPLASDATRVFTRLIDAVWNERRVEVLDELLAPDFVMHTTGGLRLDAAGYAAAVRAHAEGFPDLRVEVLAVVEQGSTVAARIQLVGTMLGAFGGHAATGRAMRVEGRPWMRVENGRIAEFWALVDDEAMWAQLGLPAHVL